MDTPTNPPPPLPAAVNMSHFRLKPPKRGTGNSHNITQNLHKNELFLTMLSRPERVSKEVKE